MQLNPSQLSAVLHLSSSVLPIGGYSYSQALESAVELGLVHDEASTLNWIHEQAQWLISRCDAPIWWLLFDAWMTEDLKAAQHWNRYYYALRETAELRLESSQMGWSLHQLATSLDWYPAEVALNLEPLCFLSVHALCCAHLQLPATAGLTGFLYSWLENQVMAAIKSVPLGQMAGQRILQHVQGHFPELIHEAQARSQDNPPRIQSFAPRYALVSARHEHQFNRLFRS